ncbi:hypothetical protein NECAME_17635 [Necator americanus]|uniref:Hyaluronidase n=1 Tax=Necator americanus TaxID=51031 RepID=W2TL10_NECAM|nr:hypothetical protein NECAME_17635 [Necator americanus]ETN82765.1 hypothetical protein NECAME_17635 [Necator americanus]
MHYLMKTYFLSLLPTFLSAFKAYWNFPSETCQQKYKIDFDKYEVETNAGLKFFGDKVALFYESKFGLYPYYKDYDENKPVNGGTPQNCTLNDHLEVAKKNITTQTEDNFNGLGVIDLEEWRPIYEQNVYKKEVYKNASLKLANGDPVKAKSDFDQAARNFFVETVRMARAERKTGKWGYYGFPYCNYNAGATGDRECRNDYRKWNDDMMFFYNETTAFYPSTYFSFVASPMQRYLYVKAVLNETRRINEALQRSIPIYLYITIEYKPKTELDSFYDDADLCSAIKQPADMGVDGIILWSSSSNMSKRCEKIKNAMENRIGEKIQKTVEGHAKCRKEKCNENGKCVRKGDTHCIVLSLHWHEVLGMNAFEAMIPINEALREVYNCLRKKRGASAAKTGVSIRMIMNANATSVTLVNFARKQLQPLQQR